MNEDIDLEEESEEEKVDDIENQKDEFITLRFTRSQVIFLSFIGVFAAGLVVGYLIWGQASNVPIAQAQSAQQPNQSQQQTGQSQAPPQNVQRYDVPVDDDPALGAADAPITIIEFSDFECPYCTRFHQETFALLLENYGDQIRFVYRDFPLTSIHLEAFPAAEAANCAREQGEYWAYHDKLFTGGPQALGADNYIAYATELGLDLEQFQECVASRRYQEEVQADLDYALALGVQSTPTFFVNGIAVVGAQPYDVFAELIENELAGEIP